MVEDDVAVKREEEVSSLREQIDRLETDKFAVEEKLNNTEEQTKMLADKLNRLNNEKEEIDSSITSLLR